MVSTSPWRFSPSTGGFYHAAVNRDVPDDAVPVSERYHAGLMRQQEAGRRIVAMGGRPAIGPLPEQSGEALRARAVVRIKAEASARILVIASLEQQSNDNAALAVAALAGALSDQAAAALDRRGRIDAVRDASNRIEATLAALSVAELIDFDAAAAFDGDRS